MLKSTQHRQKYYVDPRCRKLEFCARDMVFLKVSSSRGCPILKIKESCVLATYGLLRYSRELDEIYIIWHYLLNWKMCIMYFIYPCSESIY